MDTTVPTSIHQGSCHCNSVQYQLTGSLRGVVNCHCQTCRRLHGSYGSYTSVPIDNIDYICTRGLGWYKSTSTDLLTIERGYCTSCGASLFWHVQGGDRISIAAGSLNQPNQLATIGHIWVSQKADFYEITDNLPQYQGSLPQQGA